MNVVWQELSSQDSAKRPTDKLRALVQKSSISSCVNEHSNIVIAIPNTIQQDELKKFFNALKTTACLVVLIVGSLSSEHPFGTALNVDSALHGPGMFQNPSLRNQNSNFQPMAIANVEITRYGLKNAETNFADARGHLSSRQSDVVKNA